MTDASEAEVRSASGEGRMDVLGGLVSLLYGLLSLPGLESSGAVGVISGVLGGCFLLLHGVPG